MWWCFIPKDSVAKKTYCWWFRNPAFTSWDGKFPIIYRVLYIPGGAGFLPSTVVIHQPISSCHLWFVKLSLTFTRSWISTKRGRVQNVFVSCPNLVAKHVFFSCWRNLTTKKTNGSYPNRDHYARVYIYMTSNPNEQHSNHKGSLQKNLPLSLDPPKRGNSMIPA